MLGFHNCTTRQDPCIAGGLFYYAIQPYVSLLASGHWVLAKIPKPRPTRYGNRAVDPVTTDEPRTVVAVKPDDLLEIADLRPGDQWKLMAHAYEVPFDAIPMKETNIFDV